MEVVEEVVVEVVDEVEEELVVEGVVALGTSLSQHVQWGHGMLSMRKN